MRVLICFGLGFSLSVVASFSALASSLSCCLVVSFSLGSSLPFLPSASSSSPRFLLLSRLTVFLFAGFFLFAFASPFSQPLQMSFPVRAEGVAHRSFYQRPCTRAPSESFLCCFGCLIRPAGYIISLCIGMQRKN